MHYEGTLAFAPMDVQELRQRQMLADIRLLRTAIELARGAADPHLRDPLGTGLLMVRESVPGTFVIRSVGDRLDGPRERRQAL